MRSSGLYIRRLAAECYVTSGDSIYGYVILTRNNGSNRAPDHLSILCTTQIRFQAVGFYTIRVALMLLAMVMMLLNRLYLENINILETKLEVT